VPIFVDDRLHSTYVLCAVRVVGAGPIAPFVEVGGGAARLSLEVTASVAGFDLGNEVEDLVSSDDLDTTQPLIMAGGGLRLATGGASSVDLGYRYTRILVDNPKINTSLVYLGINFGR
jgi:opacity protein-like surface antigen